MIISSAGKDNINWWIDNISTICNVISKGSNELNKLITTDASK